MSDAHWASFKLPLEKLSLESIQPDQFDSVWLRIIQTIHNIQTIQTIQMSFSRKTFRYPAAAICGLQTEEAFEILS